MKRKPKNTNPNPRRPLNRFTAVGPLRRPSTIKTHQVEAFDDETQTWVKLNEFTEYEATLKLLELMEHTGEFNQGKFRVRPRAHLREAMRPLTANELKGAVAHG
jgi:hypothetical protein